MTKDTLTKMFAGLSPDEKQATIKELGITDTALQAELLGTPAASAQAFTFTAPAVQQPAPAAPAVQQPAATVQQGNAVTGDTALLLRAVTAECDSFMAANAAKISPAEAADVKKLYIQLGQMTDMAALNQYKATLEARPANPMLKEQVAASGQLQVLANGSQTVDTRTEAEKDADAAKALLAMTEDGRQAQAAVAAGKVQPAFKQFAVVAQ